MSTRARHLATVLLSAALLAGPTASFAAPADDPSGEIQGGGSSDPRGDVEVDATEPVYPPDLDRIDLTAVSWRVATGRRVTFRLRVVDLVDGKHQVFYGVTAYAGADTLVLGVRGRRVLVLGDTEVRRCPGSRATSDRRRDVVRFSVPVRCLSTSDTYDFAAAALLESRGGRDLASDLARRTGRVTIR
jgi:hypothetical protein